MKWIVLLLVALPASAQSLFVRAGLGLDHTRGTSVRDADCSATNPPALFGCVDGGDGEPLAARGDFGTADVFELGVGRELTPSSQVELLLARRNGLGLDARANFPGVTGEQPVRASAESTALFLLATYDFRAGAADARPFFTGGVGVARNELGAVTFAFPGIAPDAVTVLRGGTSTSIASLFALGIAFSMTERIDLDLAVRYTDLGTFDTNDGAATIVRPRGTSVIDIAGTRTRLDTVGVAVSMRYRIR